MNRVGILGGTLDPIHCGHLAAAAAARDAFDLPRVLVLPSNVPPHRPVQPLASPFHRFAMAALAVSGLPRLEACDDELRADGPSYTADTLARLHAGGHQPSQIFFITGADAFADIASWKRYPEVLDRAHFVVVSRPGYDSGALADRLPDLRPRMRPAGAPARTDGSTLIFLLEAPTPDVSSTAIRDRLRRGDPLSGLVPPLVETHIRQHRLYLPADQLHGQS
ncbi:MAG TPA: nicotinate-nucleotide adenylyltransferase [Vicinamibacterales bacterium]|jgi:nicotinate-nucleotide adenylyltransferase|nr:nicotinate-nucleotide adenylyltransferase [Vicinamibacterales bacterium]